jgi:pimeloyl-ACP methyl ester carboxylesterase
MRVLRSFLLICLATVTTFSRAAAPDTLKVGSVLLQRCAQAYCGDLQRPLDPDAPAGARIPIHFEYYPRAAPGPAIGTLVATEGGPGYPATLSREEYLGLYRPLMADHDVLFMDNRGTGQSAAVNCPDLQRAAQVTTALIGACGRSLGAAAPLLSTAFAADDLAAVLDALQVDRIDLYGDSYGTYFAQVFAVRHATRLRSIVLDGAYPLRGPDYAWYASYAPAMRDKLNLACARSAHCARIPGDSIQHIAPALRQLRAKPFAASAANADGEIVHFQADAARLATVMFSAAPAHATLRETDAAARSFANGDQAPLLRLMAETLSAVDSRDPSEDPTQWSSGLAVAVMCQDTPQIFDMRAAPAARRAQFERALRARARSHPQAYAPFSVDEYRGLPLDYSFIEQCLEWPASDPHHPASQVIAPEATYPDVPALIISGEYDNITTVADGAAAAKEFARGRQVIIANSFHVNALPRSRSDCAAQIVRRFIGTLATGDTTCAAQVPDLPLAQDFALTVGAVEPARPLPGNTADDAQRRCISAAVFTAADVLTRVRSNGSGHGVGLRGGDFHVRSHDDAASVELNAVRWTPDLAVSGHLQWRGAREPVSGELTWNSAVGATASSCGSAHLSVSWPQDTRDGRATVSGSIAGAAVNAELPVP